MKLCLFCRHFYLSPWHPGYSERTPGGDMAIYCNLEKWDFGDADSAKDARSMMLMAENCDRYELSDDAAEILHHAGEKPAL